MKPSKAIATFFVALVTLAALYGAPGASAEVLPDCGSLNTTETEPDGSVLAAGSTYPCDGVGPIETKVVLVRMLPNGTPDPDFWIDGMRVLPRSYGSHVIDMKIVDGKIVLVTGRVLVRLNADGSLDSGFGTDGLAPDYPPAAFVTDSAVIDRDGTATVAGTIEEGYRPSEWKPILTRFDGQGHLDPVFGEDGVATPEVPELVEGFGGIGRMNIQGNRILLAGRAGYGGDGYALSLLRLDGDGAVDQTFGSGSQGLAQVSGVFETYDGAERWVSMLGSAEGGHIQVVHGAFWRGWKVSSSKTYLSSFTGEGLPLEEFPVTLYPEELSGFAQLPGGDLAAAGYENNYVGYSSAPQISNRMRILRYDSPGSAGSNGRGFALEFEPSPGSSSLHSVEYHAESGSLVATGSMSKPHCVVACEVEGAHMAIAKFDAVTGLPDPGFGTGGFAMVKANECELGVVDPPPGYPATPWNRCLLAKPMVDAAASFNGVRGKKPSMGIQVRMPEPPSLPLLLARQIRIDLPQRVRWRGRKPSISVRAVSSRLATNEPVEAEVRVRRKGRTLFIRYEPQVTSEYGERYVAPNSELKVSVRLKPGSLKPIGKRLRRRQLRLKFTGTQIGGRWFGDRSTTKVTRVRPVESAR